MYFISCSLVSPIKITEIEDLAIETTSLVLLHRLFISSDNLVSFSRELVGLLYTLLTVKYAPFVSLILIIAYYLNIKSMEISDDSR